jgi:hypothetical protein
MAFNADGITSPTMLTNALPLASNDLRLPRCSRQASYHLNSSDACRITAEGVSTSTIPLVGQEVVSVASAQGGEPNDTVALEGRRRPSRAARL